MVNTCKIGADFGGGGRPWRASWGPRRCPPRTDPPVLRHSPRPRHPGHNYRTAPGRGPRVFRGLRGGSPGWPEPVGFFWRIPVGGVTRGSGTTKLNVSFYNMNFYMIVVVNGIWDLRDIKQLIR